MSRIYLASSWRNQYQPAFVKMLRGWSHQVYDFRDPEQGLGFKWSDVDPAWEAWGTSGYIDKLRSHPRCAQGFMSDLKAMQWCDTCVLLAPCGRSAHLELGWCAGRGKRTIIYIPESQEPELMYLLADHMVNSIEELQFVCESHT